MKVSVVIPTWRRDVSFLARTLLTLSAQTLQPHEVIVVNMNGKSAYSNAVHRLDDCVIVDSPRDKFHLSHGFNVGIRATSEESDYILCTGAEMLFSANYLEELAAVMSPEHMGLGRCGFLPKGTKYPDDIIANWDDLVEQVIPLSAAKVSPGTFQCAKRDWWFRVRGYDEHLKFAYIDSDITQRGKMSGLKYAVMSWEQAQVMHQWHEKSELVSKLGGRLEYVLKNISVVRNGENWGT